MKSRKPEDNIEEQLSLELENLYKEIEHPGKVDKIVEAGGKEPDLRPAYELFKVEPDAGHDELKSAYEELASAWNPKRFEDHPEWKDKAEKKLDIINKAYEMILSARIREIRNRRKTINLEEIEKEAAPAQAPAYTKDVEAHEEEPEEEEETRRFGLKHALIFASVPVFLALCWFVVSPLFEKQPDIKADKKIAGEKLPPLDRSAQPAPAPEPGPGVKPEPKTEVKPETAPKPEIQAPPAVEPPRAVAPPPPPPAPKPVAKEQKPAPAALKPVTETKPQTPKAAPKTDVAKKGAATARMPYSIQIGAVKDRAKGAEYLAKVKKDGYSANLVETKLPGGEKGYRILIGGFQSRDEAFSYMNDKGLKQKYPGSFVQKNAP